MVNPLLSIVCPMGPGERDNELIPLWMNKISGKEIEIIFVLDNASDLTESVIKNLTKDLRNVKISKCSASSPGLARNLGLQQATGKWIGFWDSDDYPDVDKYFKLVQESDEAGFSVGCGQFSKFDAKGTQAPILKQPRNKPASLKSILVAPGIWRFCFKREVLSEKSFPPQRMGEDQVFLAHSLENQDVYISKEIIYYYRLNSKNQLTAQNVNLKDLPISFSQILDFYSVSRSRNDITTAIMLSNLLITSQLRTSSDSRRFVKKILAKRVSKMNLRKISILSYAILYCALIKLSGRNS